MDDSEKPSGEEEGKRLQTSYNSKWFSKSHPRVRRIALIFLVAAWVGSAIGIWWDIGQIQEKGIFEITDSSCDDELFYEFKMQIDDLKLQLDMDVDAGWITQAEADERISDLREEVVNYQEQEESDCFRTGSLLIGAGAFIVISVPLAVIAVVRGRRKEKLDFSSSVPKQPKKNNDMFNDSDDFDNPIFS